MKWNRLGITPLSIPIPIPIPSHLSLQSTLFSSSNIAPTNFNQPYNLHLQSSPLHWPKSEEKNPETLHAKLIKDSSFQSTFSSNHLLDLYVRSPRLFPFARQLFDEIPHRDVRTWTILISSYARNGMFSLALGLFRRMVLEGACPNWFTVASVLKCCASLCEIKLGMGVHGWVLRNGVGSDIVLDNSILDVYVKCGAIGYARKLFELMEDRDTVSWNIMIGGYLSEGEVERSLELFQGLHLKDVASWNTMIDGLMRNGFKRTALELLYNMVAEGTEFNAVTFSIALSLASCLPDLELGKQIHGCVVKLVTHDNGFVRNSILDMYCKCGAMGKASTIFTKIPVDISANDPLAQTVSFSSMVAGYVKNGEYDCALRTLSSMIFEQVHVDKFTLTSVLSACAHIGLLELGRQIHAYIHKIGHKLDAHLGSSLIDMYAKCGSLTCARRIFGENIDSNTILWTSMISGCAFNGEGREAVQLFECMINKKAVPNEVTFVGLLNACSHSGMPDEGLRYFQQMQKVYGIKPGVDHYVCMVDSYGRAGRLNELRNFILENGISHLSAVWKSLLSCCRLHKNVEISKWVLERLYQFEPSDGGSYVLLSNIFASDRRWEEAAEVRTLMQTRKVNKLPGQSWIFLKDQVHKFVMGDRSHPQEAEIYSYLEKLIGRLKEMGYSSDARSVMHDVDEEQTLVLLYFHSEKLALVCGIINMASGIPIRIMKNLRICSDCHEFMKYSSQLLEREIIVRDLRRFHHFKHGLCSCRDCW